MNKHIDWRERYEKEDTPWETGRPDSNIIRLVTDGQIKPCSVLEIGCGTGAGAVWLAQNGFTVTAVDISDIAIEKAGQRASEQGVECRFLVSDFLNDGMKTGRFEFAFDRGCFHTFDSPDERKKFAKHVAECLETNGLWLSLLGCTDDEPRETGPPQRSAKDVADAVEPYFEILSLTSGHFDSNRERAPRCWICLMRKRPIPD